MVRSHLEYGSVVWSVATKKNLMALEAVQRRATKYILGFPCGDTYKARLIKCNLQPLSYRRELLDLVFLYKCLNGYYSVKLDTLFPVHTNNLDLRNSDNSIRFKPSRCHTETFRYSYANRTIVTWNNLPCTIKASTSVSMFKTRLSQHYNSLRAEYFDSLNTCT